jgi:glycosyltransferase involved in cell wall biosynthesis
MHLHIVGEGKDLAALQVFARQLALDGNITFYGAQTNPYRFMSHADMLILTSRHEAAPMVFTEARILGLPIIATPSTSTRELIEDVHAGVVCQSDPAAISAAIHSMYTQKHRYSTVPYQPNKERQRTLAVFERLVRLS